MKKYVCLVTVASVGLFLLCSCSTSPKQENPAIHMRADEVQSSKGIMTAKGNVIVDTENYVVYAPELVYSPTNSTFVFKGPVKVVLTNQTREAFMKHLNIDND